MSAKLLLHIETSSPVCSVALSEDGRLVALKELSGNANHAAMLTVLINELMTSVDTDLKSLDGIAVSAGPGSYTGLRIGAATAKGLCYALSKPLIAIDSLQSLAIGMCNHHQDKQSYMFCPTIDARRNEIYFGLFAENGIVLQPSSNTILTESFLDHLPGNKPILLGGSGTSKCYQLLASRNNFEFDYTTLHSAQWMIAPATLKLMGNDFTNFQTFEPNYIKPAFLTEKKKIF